MRRFRNLRDCEQPKSRSVVGSLKVLLVVFAAGLALFSKTASGITFQDSKLLECLSDDTLAAVIISDPTAVMNSVHECLSGSNEWNQFVSSFGEEYSVYVTQSQLDSLMESFGRLDRVLRDFESVSIVLHSFKAGQPNFSIIVESTDEQCTAFQREMSLLWATYSETKLHEQYSKSISELFGRIKYSKVDRFHVFSASDSDPQISNSQKPSLFELRSFRRGWNQIAKTPWDIAIYFSPRQATELAELYLNVRPENSFPGNRRVALPKGFDDIVCLCTSIDLKSDSKNTRALIRSFLCFTVPRSGIAQVWQSYPAITEYPYLPFSVFEFKAQGNPYNEDTGLGANFSARLLIETSKTTPPEQSALYFDEVISQEVAKRHIERLQQNAKGLISGDMGMREVQTDGSFWMAKETDEYARRQIKGRVEHREHLRTLNEEQVTRLMEHVRQTRVLDARWHILGYSGSIMDLLEPGKVDREDYGSVIKERVASLASRTQALSEPFAIEAYSPLSYNVLWMVHGHFWPNRPSHKAGSDDAGPLPKMAKLGINAIAQRHGTQLWIYSQNASMMQVDVDVFTTPEWLFPDATEKFGETWFGKGYGGW